MTKKPPPRLFFQPSRSRLLQPRQPVKPEPPRQPVQTPQQSASSSQIPSTASTSEPHDVASADHPSIPENSGSSVRSFGTIPRLSLNFASSSTEGQSKISRLLKPSVIRHTFQPNATAQKNKTAEQNDDNSVHISRSSTVQPTQSAPNPTSSENFPSEQKSPPPNTLTEAVTIPVKNASQGSKAQPKPNVIPEGPTVAPVLSKSMPTLKPPITPPISSKQIAPLQPALVVLPKSLASQNPTGLSKTNTLANPITSSKLTATPVPAMGQRPAVFSMQTAMLNADVSSKPKTPPKCTLTQNVKVTPKLTSSQKPEPSRPAAPEETVVPLKSAQVSKTVGMSNVISLPKPTVSPANTVSSNPNISMKPTSLTKQTESPKQMVPPKQTASTKQVGPLKPTALTRQTQTTRQTPSSNQTVPPKQTTSTKQTESPKQMVPPKQTASTKQVGPLKPTALARQTQTTRQTPSSNQTVPPKHTSSTKQTESPRQMVPPKQTASTKQVGPLKPTALTRQTQTTRQTPSSNQTVPPKHTSSTKQTTSTKQTESPKQMVPPKQTLSPKQTVSAKRTIPKKSNGLPKQVSVSPRDVSKVRNVTPSQTVLHRQIAHSKETASPKQAVQQNQNIVSEQTHGMNRDEVSKQGTWRSLHSMPRNNVLSTHSASADPNVVTKETLSSSRNMASNQSDGPKQELPLKTAKQILSSKRTATQVDTASQQKVFQPEETRFQKRLRVSKSNISSGLSPSTATTRLSPFHKDSVSSHTRSSDTRLKESSLGSESEPPQKTLRLREGITHGTSASMREKGLSTSAAEAKAPALGESEFPRVPRLPVRPFAASGLRKKASEIPMRFRVPSFKGGIAQPFQTSVPKKTRSPHAILSRSRTVPPSRAFQSVNQTTFRRATKGGSPAHGTLPNPADEGCQKQRCLPAPAELQSKSSVAERSELPLLSRQGAHFSSQQSRSEILQSRVVPTPLGSLPINVLQGMSQDKRDGFISGWKAGWEAHVEYISSLNNHASTQSKHPLQTHCSSPNVHASSLSRPQVPSAINMTSPQEMSRHSEPESDLKSGSERACAEKSARSTLQSHAFPYTSRARKRLRVSPAAAHSEFSADRNNTGSSHDRILHERTRRNSAHLQTAEVERPNATNEVQNLICRTAQVFSRTEGSSTQRNQDLDPLPFPVQARTVSNEEARERAERTPMTGSNPIHNRANWRAPKPLCMSGALRENRNARQHLDAEKEEEGSAWTSALNAAAARDGSREHGEVNGSEGSEKSTRMEERTRETVIAQTIAERDPRRRAPIATNSRVGSDTREANPAEKKNRQKELDEIRVQAYAEQFGLVIVERNREDGLAEWLGCKFCAVFGCRTRDADFLMAHRAPFAMQDFVAHLEKDHCRKWQEYERADAAGKKEFFRGKELRAQAFLQRVAELKANLGPNMRRRRVAETIGAVVVDDEGGDLGRRTRDDLSQIRAVISRLRNSDAGMSTAAASQACAADGLQHEGNVRSVQVRPRGEACAWIKETEIGGEVAGTVLLGCLRDEEQCEWEHDARGLTDTIVVEDDGGLRPTTLIFSGAEARTNAMHLHSQILPSTGANTAERSCPMDTGKRGPAANALIALGLETMARLLLIDWRNWPIGLSTRKCPLRGAGAIEVLISIHNPVRRFQRLHLISVSNGSRVNSDDGKSAFADAGRVVTEVLGVVCGSEWRSRVVGVHTAVGTQDPEAAKVEARVLEALSVPVVRHEECRSKKPIFPWVLAQIPSNEYQELIAREANRLRHALGDARLTALRVQQELLPSEVVEADEEEETRLFEAAWEVVGRRAPEAAVLARSLATAWLCDCNCPEGSLDMGPEEGELLPDGRKEGAGKTVVNREAELRCWARSLSCLQRDFDSDV